MSVVVPGQSEAVSQEIASLTSQAHRHENKALLDSLSGDEGYLLLREKTEGSGESERKKVKSGYADESGVADDLSPSSVVWQKVLRKDVEDTAAEVVNFTKGLRSPGFVSDSLGMGIYQDGDGNWVIEGDFFHVRKKLTAESVEVMHTSHVGGKLIASPGNLVVSSVEIPDGVSYYRCRFKLTTRCIARHSTCCSRRRANLGTTTCGVE